MNESSAVGDLLTDPAFYLDEGYHEVFATLRDEEPVLWTEGRYPRGFWSFTRYDDCLWLHDDLELFSSSMGAELPPGGRELTDEERFARGYDIRLVTADPPVHWGKRQPFNKHFAMPVVQRMHQSVVDIVTEVIDSVASRGTADLVNDVIGPVPVNVILGMMGVPREDWPYLQDVTHRLRNPQDPRNQGSSDSGPSAYVSSTVELYDYMSAHMLSRRGHPTEDFSSLIANMEDDNGLLDDRFASWMAFSMVAGGLETTRATTALGIIELLKRPDQIKLMLADPAVLKTGIEEITRYTTPVKNRLRVATRDVERHGKLIRKGDWVVGWIASANRDPRAFENPDEFDVTRKVNPHLTFGGGPHLCLGRNLSRLEMMEMLPRIFTELPNLRLDGEVDRYASVSLSSVKSMPVAFDPR